MRLQPHQRLRRPWLPRARQQTRSRQTWGFQHEMPAHWPQLRSNHAEPASPAATGQSGRGRDIELIASTLFWPRCVPARVQAERDPSKTAG